MFHGKSAPAVPTFFNLESFEETIGQRQRASKLSQEPLQASQVKAYFLKYYVHPDSDIKINTWKRHFLFLFLFFLANSQREGTTTPPLTCEIWEKL